MRERGFAALEAAGMVLTALAFPALIHGLLDPDFALPRSLFGWMPGGSAGRTAALASVALLAASAGGWAHTRRGTAARRTALRGTTARRRAEPSALRRADETGGGP